MPHDAFSVARARLLLDHPFFGALALHLPGVPDETVSTLAVDGERILYNPQFFDGLSPTLRTSAIAHEVVHCVMEHLSRRAARSKEKWNAACDYAVNAILHDAGIELGPGWLLNSRFHGMSAETIYELLPDAPGDSDQGLCDIRTPASEVAEEVLQTAWKCAAVQAAKQTGAGKLPEQLRKLLDSVLAPTAPWREVLARFMTERTKSDYSWRRPNPYYTHAGVYLPVMDGVGMGEVVIALDTSGSVVSVLDEFGAAVNDVVATTTPRRVHLVYCDARVNRVDVFERGQELNFEAVGGGGTDFRPVFDYVRDQGIRPACLLYLTDMYGHFPQEAPDYPVMWCATSEQTGPFGETLRIK